MKESVVMNNGFYGVDSSTARLKRVMMMRPSHALLTADRGKWHYGDGFSGDRIKSQYDSFITLIEKADVEIVWLGDCNTDIADSVFTHDASILCPAGAILMNPGKPLRRGEENLHAALYEEQGIPILGRLQGSAHAEGGDTLWLDEKTLAVGRGFRTNQAGIDVLVEILSPHGIEVCAYDLPCYLGSEACLHLMSIVNPLAEDLSLIHSLLLPVGLYQKMRDMGYQLIDVPADEFVASNGLNVNVLATANRECIAIQGFPKTLELMRRAGCEVQTFDASALCIPCEGGPTCMTRPLLREHHRGEVMSGKVAANQ